MPLGASNPCQDPVTKLGICEATVGTPGVAAKALALDEQAIRENRNRVNRCMVVWRGLGV